MTPRLLVLQATSLCNLDCAYCYVPDRANAQLMSEETLRAALALGLSRHRAGDALRILWHAGEPLAAGLAFYERAAELIRAATPAGVHVGQAMQTNGTLVDDAWCRFFAREQVTVGLSLDGPAQLHDGQRRTVGGAPTHAQVERAARLLRAHGRPLHALAVLTARSLDCPDEIFDYFAGAGFDTVAFNVEETEGPHRSTLDGTARARYQKFLARLLARWHAAGRKPRIREFESMSAAVAALARDAKYVRAVDDSVPLRNLAVSRAGDISTFSPELAGGTPSDPLRFSIGNVHRARSLDELARSPRLVIQRDELARGVDRCRAGCGYFALCGGGTASNKFFEHGTFDCAETASCVLHRQALADAVREAG